MIKIKYDINLIKYISLFETMTGVKLKDCFVDVNDNIVFVVDEIYVGKAIGKNSQNIRNLENLIKKRIKIVGFSNDIRRFIKNLVYPSRVRDIEVDGKIIKITPYDMKTKGFLIGRDSKNLKNLKNSIKRYFDIDDVKIV